MEAALRPLLAASKITAAQRDRQCLIPEAQHAGLLRLVRIYVSARDKRGRAMRATGLSNAAVAACATVDELQSVIALQANFAESMRRLILAEISRYAVEDVNRRERQAQNACDLASSRRLEEVASEDNVRTDRDQPDVLNRVTFVWIAGDEAVTNKPTGEPPKPET